MPLFSSLRTLIDVFSNYRWHVLALVVLGSVSAVLEGIGINAIIPLISFFGQGAGASTDFISKAIQALFHFLSIPFTFRYLLGFILLLFFTRAVAMVVFGYTRGWISADFLSTESKTVLRATMRASWPFLLSQKIGTIQNSLIRDIQCSENLLSVTGQVIQSFTGLLMYLLVAFNISPPMTILTLVGGLFLLMVARPFLGRTQRAGEEMAATEKKFAQFLSEHIIGMKAIKTAGVEEPAFQKSNALVAYLRTLSIRMTLIRSASSSMFQPFSLLFVIALFSVTYRTPDFNIITFAAILYLIQKIFTYIESGQAAFHSMSQLIPYAQNVVQFKKTLAEHTEEVSAGQKEFSFTDAISFAEVHFSYVENREVLCGVDFSLRKGETVGIIGPSGAGKTSIADLVLRLFKPNKGDILIDGKSIHTIAIESWRHNIGYVAQEVFLLNASIEDNIRFYHSEYTHEAIIAAAKQANIYDFIMGLPDGFNTTTGDRGVMLSGGQRQRIALARALAGKPTVLILDEATSALDSESEKLIQESIHALHGSVTVLIIAHRLSTVEHADRLLVLDHGHITETGTPEELLSRSNSYFAKHYRHLRR